MSLLIECHQNLVLHKAYIFLTLKCPPNAELCNSAHTASTRSLSLLGNTGTYTSSTSLHKTPYLMSHSFPRVLPPPCLPCTYACSACPPPSSRLRLCRAANWSSTCRAASWHQRIVLKTSGWSFKVINALHSATGGLDNISGTTLSLP